MDERMIVGILISLLFTELTNLSPGGIIVPAYMTLYLFEPKRIVLTLATSLLCLLILNLLERVTILYGRRKFAMFLLVGMLLKVLFSFLYTHEIITFTNFALSIGYFVPGLLAKDMEKQGILTTLFALGIVVFLLYLINIVFLV